MRCIYILRKAGQTAGLIELNLLWTIMGGLGDFFIKTFFSNFFHGQRRALQLVLCKDLKELFN